MLILKVLLLSIILIAISLIFLATQIILKKGGRFPKTSIGHNPDMRKLGITCAKCEELRKCAIAKREAESKAAIA